MNTAVISVGSNIDPHNNIELAKAKITSNLKLLKSSEFIFTKPIGYLEQDDFLNGAFLVETDMNRQQLEEYLKNVENQLGRVRTSMKYGPRVIDLDIVVWNGDIIDESVYEREFLKISVQELLPGFTF